MDGRGRKGIRQIEVGNDNHARTRITQFWEAVRSQYRCQRCGDWNSVSSKQETDSLLEQGAGVRKVEWSVYIEKMMAVVEAMRLWRPYLLGCKFIIVTDQQPLRHLLEQRIATPEWQKFVAKLMGFEIEIWYQPGKKNIVADALSQRTDSPELNDITGPKWNIWNWIRAAIQEEPALIEIRQKLNVGEMKVREEYEWRDDLLTFHGKVVVPDRNGLRNATFPRIAFWRAFGDLSDMGANYANVGTWRTMLELLCLNVTLENGL